MSSQSETAHMTGVVREAIPFARFPWIRPLVQIYTHQFASIAPMFAGDPNDHAAWAETIGRVHRRADSRLAVAHVLLRQLERRQAPAAAREGAAALAEPDTVAVVTGQQAGAFGGPLYSLLKAVTAVQLARKISAEHRVRAVPIFWVDAEDHDWDEVCTAHLLDRESAPTSVTLPPMPGCGSHPVSRLTFDEGVNDALLTLEQLLPRTDFTGELLETLRRAYRPGASVSGAFASLMDSLLGSQGLVSFESDDPQAKPLVASLFVDELHHPGRTARLAREAGQSLAALGHSPQIEPADDVVGLFYVNDRGREPIHRRDATYVVGDDVRDVSDLADEARTHPERFSPNVLLRPLVQDLLFPTVCYVAGPSELAYHAQLGGIYSAFGVPRPLLLNRASATLLDSAALRFLERHDVPFEGLQPQDEAALNRLLESLLPAAVEQTIENAGRQIADQAARLKEAVAGIDPTLSGTVDTTIDRVRDTLRTLHNKIVQATKKKDETLRRQFIRTRNLAFPEGHPQERHLCVSFFVNRYGPGVTSQLIDSLPLPAEAHYLVMP